MEFEFDFAILFALVLLVFFVGQFVFDRFEESRKNTSPRQFKEKFHSYDEWRSYDKPAYARRKRKI